MVEVKLEEKFTAGDHVLVGYKNSKSEEGVLLYESPDNAPCMIGCGDDNCKEWANVLLTDGSGYLYHISECRLTLSEFGKALHKHDHLKKAK